MSMDNNTVTMAASTIVPFSDTTILHSLIALLCIAAVLVLLYLLSRHLERQTTVEAFDETLTMHYEDLTHVIEDAYINVIHGQVEQSSTPPKADGGRENGSSLSSGNDSEHKRRYSRRRSSTMMGQGLSSRTHHVSQAKSFTVNLRRSLKDSIVDLCQLDVVFVSQNLVDLRQLKADCTDYVLEHRISSLKEASPTNVVLPADKLRPQFIACVLAQSVTPAHIGSLFNRGFDGILLQGLKEASDVQSSSKAWLMNLLVQCLDVTAAADKPLIVEVEYGMFHMLRESLKYANGLLFRNPTMTTSGYPHMHFGTDHDYRDAFMGNLKKHLSMSVDFSLFSLTCVNGIDALRPELMQSCLGGAWAKSIPILHRFCSDPTLLSVSETCRVDSTLSALELIKSGGAIEEVLQKADSIVVATPSDELVKCLELQGDLSSASQTQGSDSLSSTGSKTVSDGGGFDSAILVDSLIGDLGGVNSSNSIPHPSDTIASNSVWKSISASSSELSDMVDSDRSNGVLGLSASWFNTEVTISNTRHKGSILEDAGGQKLIGTRVDRAEYNIIIARLISQRKIHHNSGCLLENLSAPSMREQFSGNERQNTNALLFDPRFVRIEKQLQSIISQLDKRQDILRAVQGIDVQSELVHLLHRMRQPVEQPDGMILRSVQIWFCYPRILRTEISGTMKSLIALSQNAGEITHIYISSAHTSPIEGVLHCYFQSLGCTHKQCIVLELLSQLATHYASQQPSVLPLRVLAQIKESSLEDLCLLTQRTYKILFALKRLKGPTQLVELLCKMALAVREKSLVGLTDNTSADSRRKFWADISFEENTRSVAEITPQECDPGNSLASVSFSPRLIRLKQLVKRACWRGSDRKQLKRLIDYMASLDMTPHFKHGNATPRSFTDCQIELPDGARLCLELVLALQAAVRDEFVCEVREADTWPVRESDLTTVLLEMIGISEEDIFRAFRVSKRHCARRVHAIIQNKIRIENPPASLFKPVAENAYDLENKEASTKEKVSQYGNGMFFSSSVFLEQLLVVATGSGLFSSSQMSTQAKSIVSSAMLAAFILNGGINAAIGRTSSFYMFQYSFSLASVAVVERIGGGFLFALPFGVIGGIISGLGNSGVSWGILFFLCFMLFFIYLMLVAALVSIRIKSIWQSSGGRSILVGYAIMSIPALSSSTGLLESAVESGTLVLFYVLALFITNLQMLWSLHHICVVRCQCFENIYVASDKDLDVWARDFCSQLDFETLAANTIKADPAVQKKWNARRRYLLRLAYAQAVREALKQRSLMCPGLYDLYQKIKRHCCVCCTEESPSIIQLTNMASSWLVTRRAKLFAKEELLVQWYLLQSSQARPPPLSDEWESCVDEALTAMKMKRMTDVGIRPGLLFTFEMPEMLYGWLYFLFIFVDRLAYLISGSGVFLFSGGNISSYTVGMGWATMYLLLCTGGLEIAMARLMNYDKSFLGKRLGPDGAAGQLSEKVLRKQNLYTKEVKNIFKLIGGLFVPTTCILVVTEWSTPWDISHPILPYFIGCLGYAGLIFALFNKLYMGSNTVAALKMIFCAVVAGVLSGVLLLVATNFESLASCSTLVAGWSYAIASYMFISHRDESSISKWGDDHKLLSPNILTSGQSWIGSRSSNSAFARSSCIKRLKMLPSDKRVGISPDSRRGKDIIEMLSETQMKVKQGMLHPALKECFADNGKLLGHMIDHAIRALAEGYAQIFICPQEDMRGDSGEGFSAIASMASDGMSYGFAVYVGVPWRRKNDPSVVNQLLCEAYLHEIAEHYLGAPHQCATLFELCLLPMGLKENDIINVSNFKRLPRRILSQINQMDAPALHALERGTDRAIFRNSTFGINIALTWREFSSEARDLFLCLMELSRPASPRSTFFREKLFLLRRHFGPKRYQHAISEFFFALLDHESDDSPFLLPDEVEKLKFARFEVEKVIDKLAPDDFATSKIRSRIANIGDDLLPQLVARAQIANCLAVSIKQATRVSLDNKLLHFYKPDTHIRKPWLHNCAPFGTFDQQLLDCYLKEKEYADARLHRNDRNIKSSWQLYMFGEIMYLSLTGSSALPQEAYYVLKEAQVSCLLRLAVKFLAVPYYKLGRKLKLSMVYHLLWKGRHDVVNFLRNVSIGLNRVVERTTPNLWYIQGCNPANPEVAWLRIKGSSLTAEATHYSMVGSRMSISNHGEYNSRSKEFSKEARVFEPDSMKLMIARVKYSLRDEKVHRGVMYPRARLVTREQFKKNDANAKKKPLSTTTYEYESSESIYPAGAETVDSDGNLQYKRFFDSKGRVIGESIVTIRRLHDRSPKIIGNKSYMKGYLKKRKKKAYGWTGITRRFFVSNPENGELCFFKSDVDWNAGEPPRTRVNLAGIGVRVKPGGIFVLVDLVEDVDLYELTTNSVKSKQRWVVSLKNAIKSANKKDPSRLESLKLTPEMIAKNAKAKRDKLAAGKRGAATKNGLNGAKKFTVNPKAKMKKYGNEATKNIIIQALYVHDESVHPAESHAVQSIYECPDENWALVVNNCHHQNGSKVYSDRVTSVTLRWGKDYFHTQYHYSHALSGGNSARSARTWKISVGAGAGSVEHHASSSTESASEYYSGKRTSQVHAAAGIDAAQIASDRNSLNDDQSKNTKKLNHDPKEEPKAMNNEAFENKFMSNIGKSRHRKMRRARQKRATILEAQAMSLKGSDGLKDANSGDSIIEVTSSTNQANEKKHGKIRQSLNLSAPKARVKRKRHKKSETRSLQRVSTHLQFLHDEISSKRAETRGNSELTSKQNGSKKDSQRSRSKSNTSFIARSNDSSDGTGPGHMNGPTLESKDSQQSILDQEFGHQMSDEAEHETPWFIIQDPYDLIDRPAISSIYEEDLSLFSLLNYSGSCCTVPSLNCFDKCCNLQISNGSFDFCTGRYRTGLSRTVLWQMWNRAKGNLEGVHAQILDEVLLRSEPLLHDYWNARDGAKMSEARNALEKDQDGEMQGQHKSDILNACFVESTVGTRSRLWIRYSDLLIGATGGQSIFVSSHHDDVADEGNLLHVLGLDSGTWPMDGGGVASCRRDVVNRIDGVRWQMVAETGNDMKTVHRSYQVEEHVMSLNFVPLWGTDLGSPMQSVLSHKPLLKMKMHSWDLTTDIIEKYFRPMLHSLIIGCAQEEPFHESDIERYTNVFVNMHTFFQKYGWVKAWESGISVREWCTTWGNIYNKKRKSSIIEADLPTLEDMLITLSLFTHFLFILSVPLDSHLKVPVTHATHHGIQTLLGVVAKRKNHTALVIWDHGILWRERLRAFSNFRGFPLFARNALVGLNRLVVQINFANADIVVPCCVTNMDWEAWMGSLRGNDTLRIKALRYIYPVINGMETDRFRVDRGNEDKLPTAVMLSHVYELKGVMDAIRAASVIVNQYKISDYRLLIYGSLDKDPSYVSECRALLASNNLQENVKLMGLGNAPKVLTRGWLFVNSSLSEGLPLALGEAGLCGLPVVCTDVGGSREVISKLHGDKWTTFGRVVPPRKPALLARAQLEVFAMLGDLPSIVNADNYPSRASKTLLSLADFHGKPQELTKRIMAQRTNCRLLGMRFREFVLSNFTMARYVLSIIICFLYVC